MERISKSSVTPTGLGFTETCLGGGGPGNGGCGGLKQVQHTIFDRFLKLHEICDGLEYQVKRCKAVAEALNGVEPNASLPAGPPSGPDTDAMSILVDKIMWLERITGELSYTLNRLEAIIPPDPQSQF